MPLTIERDVMPMWAPMSYEQACYTCKAIDKVIKPPRGEKLAEWNLYWLFDYSAMRLIDGTVEGITAALNAMNPQAQGGLAVDLEENIYGIKDLAETLGPVEFINTFMRRPYKTTSLYTLCGEGVFTQARSNAEHLARNMVGKVESAGAQAREVLGNVIAFPRRK